MKCQPDRLSEIAQEWMTLRQKTLTETAPDKIAAILDRLAVLLWEADELVALGDDDSNEVRATWFDIPDEESWSSE